jgi:hypothetical protein
LEARCQPLELLTAVGLRRVRHRVHVSKHRHTDLGSPADYGSTAAAGLGDLKADPLLDPLRKEPRFQAMVRQLKFPE